MRKSLTDNISFSSIILFFVILHIICYEPSEPFFNNDETRHVMTGVFFSDVMTDMPIGHLREYATDYYLQFPALGLVVWPPLFHFLEGVFFYIFGASMVVAKMLVACFSLLACFYFYRLVRVTHNHYTALLAVTFLALCPMVFTLSSHVMLEIPALALGLAAIYYFWLYLAKEETKHLFAAAAASSMTFLTRYDGLYLVPLFLILLFVTRKTCVLKRPFVWVAVALSMILTIPFYTLMLNEFGWFHWQTITQSGVTGSAIPSSIAGMTYYLRHLPDQVGWLLLPLALLGLVNVFTGRDFKKSLPYLAIIFTTLALFSCIAEKDTRHAIYWLPAFALFAADGLIWLLDRIRILSLKRFLALILVAAALLVTLLTPTQYLHGYSQAAAYIIEQAQPKAFLLFDGALDGNFIYQISRRDSLRQKWVLRSDKLLYNSVVFPGQQYTEYALDDQHILTLIHRYDPEFLILESPRGVERVAMSSKLRRVVDAHPERFKLEKVFPVVSNVKSFRDVNLRVYRNLARNDAPQKYLEIEMLSLRRIIQTQLDHEENQAK